MPPLNVSDSNEGLPWKYLLASNKTPDDGGGEDRCDRIEEKHEFEDDEKLKKMPLKNHDLAEEDLQITSLEEEEEELDQDQEEEESSPRKTPDDSGRETANSNSTNSNSSSKAVHSNF